MISAPQRQLCESVWHGDDDALYGGGDSDDVYDAARAAGYAHSTASRMARWALVNLGGGL